MPYRKFEFGHDEEGRDISEGPPERSPLEQYGEEALRQPEYRRIGIGLGRLTRSVALIESSWQQTNRNNSLID